MYHNFNSMLLRHMFVAITNLRVFLCETCVFYTECHTNLWYLSIRIFLLCAILYTYHFGLLCDSIGRILLAQFRRATFFRCAIGLVNFASLGISYSTKVASRIRPLFYTLLSVYIDNNSLYIISSLHILLVKKIFSKREDK